MLKKYKLKDYNFLLLALVLAAMAVGVVVINSANSSFTQKQILGVILSIVIICALSVIDYHFITKFYVIFYVINVLLLLAVLVGGKSVNNAKRWFVIFGIQFQPSELSKILMIIFFSVFLDKFMDKNSVNSVKCLVPFVGLLGIPLLLIYREPDLSTTICITMVILAILFIAGVSYKIIGVTILVLIPLIGLFIWYIQQPDQKLLYAHQVTRIMSFIYPDEYDGVTDQQYYSAMAIGAGQLLGKGLNNTDVASVKGANLIPEQQTDFIFSVVGEELGFIGSVIIIALLLVIVLQCIGVARRAEDNAGMLIASGVALVIGFQTFINIGVASSYLPNTGIPLPFISYGLSSLLSTAIGIGIVLNIGMQKKDTGILTGL